MRYTASFARDGTLTTAALQDIDALSMKEAVTKAKAHAKSLGLVYTGIHKGHVPPRRPQEAR